MSKFTQMAELVVLWMETSRGRPLCLTIRDLMFIHENRELFDELVQKYLDYHAERISTPDIRSAPTLSAPDTRSAPAAAHTVADGVARLVGLIESGKTPTIHQTMELLDKPYTTAQRWLAKAKKQASDGGIK